MLWRLWCWWEDVVYGAAEGAERWVRNGGGADLASLAVGLMFGTLLALLLWWLGI